LNLELAARGVGMQCMATQSSERVSKMPKTTVLVLVLVLVLGPVAVLPSREEGPRTSRSTRTRRSTRISED
jgi:hypothetical protein